MKIDKCDLEYQCTNLHSNNDLCKLKAEKLTHKGF